MTNEQLALIDRWNKAEQNFSYWKGEESRLRREVAESVFADAKPGTHSFALDASFSIKCVIKQAIAIDKDMPKVNVAVNAMIDRGYSQEAARRLVKVKHELSESEYKDLPTEYRMIFDQVLTIKPATPTLTIWQPKRV